MKPGYMGLLGLGAGFGLLWLVWPTPPPDTLTERQKRLVVQRVHTEIMHGQLLYRLPDLQPPAVSFTVKDGRNSSESACTYAMTSAGSPAWVLRINERMAAQHWRQFLAETIPHEVGHLLRCQFDPEWQAHDARWESIIRDMGATPVARHEYLEE